jgi:hypothetical protein
MKHTIAINRFFKCFLFVLTFLAIATDAASASAKKRGRRKASAAKKAAEEIVNLDELESEDNSVEGVEPKKDGEEEAIDLDALEEDNDDTASSTKKFSIPEEPMLPVEITEREIKKKPILKLTAAVALLPVVAMLFRTKRRRARRKSDTQPKKGV